MLKKFSEVKYIIPFINLEGKRFGRLLVICRVANKGKKTCYQVSCDCGRTKEMMAYTITTHKGCGCLRLERCEAGLRKTETNPSILAERKKNKFIKDRDRWLRKNANTSLEEFETKKLKQKGLCAICGIRPATHADHDHESGKARGILCRHCNVGLGFFLDDTKILQAAILYVRLYHE
jgi:hypothetical protein